MTDFIKCIICDKRANSMSEMHLHQTTCHSIDQFSLIILSRRESKIENVVENLTKNDKNSNNSNRKKSKTSASVLQQELKDCVTAIDKVLQSSNKTEGRRKKNPRPRKNDKTETAKKQCTITT